MIANNIFNGLGLALIDALNPTTVATLIILLPLVKKRSHALIFILSTFLVYYSFGLLLYFGVAQIIAVYFDQIVEILSPFLPTLKLLLGILLLGYGIFKGIKIIRYLKSKEKIPKDYGGKLVKLVNPFAILLLGFSSTLLDLPTAVPYIGYIAVLTKEAVAPVTSSILLAFFCFIYVSPMLVIYEVFKHMDIQKFSKIQEKMIDIVGKASEYLIPSCTIILGIFLLV